ncbi:MAG: ERCC4 domain-containing protein [Patescibacteria group bacterium]
MKLPRVEPIILIDTREQLPLRFTRFASEVATLPVGDYGVKGFSDWQCPRFVVERKELNDLCGSLGNGRERFLREIEKMRQFEFRALVIEATEIQIQNHEYTSQILPASVFGTLDALRVRCNLHVLWCGDAVGAATQVENLVEKFITGIVKEFRQVIKEEAITCPR